MNKLLYPKPGQYWLYLTIPTVVFAFCIIVPIFIGGFISLFDWNGGRTMSFSGLENYQYLVSDSDFWLALKNNIEILLYCILGQVCGGFIIAVVLNSKFMKLRSVYRFCIFLPFVLSTVVVALLFQLAYGDLTGFINTALRNMGLDHLTQLWLDNPELVMKSIAVVFIWQYTGMYVVIFLSSLQNIPSDVLEMSMIDGANAFQRFFKIIVPLMKGTFRVCLLLCITGCMKLFEHILLMTGGGPGTASNVLSLFAYNTVYRGTRFGYSSAISMSILLFSSVLVFIVTMLFRGEKNEA